MSSSGGSSGGGGGVTAVTATPPAVSTGTTAPVISVPGAVIVRKFPFAFDTPNILTGAALYTPTVDDILLDAWIEIDTAWNGTTPQGDMGIFPSGHGWLYYLTPLNDVIDMTHVTPGLDGSNDHMTDIVMAQATYSISSLWGVPAATALTAPYNSLSPRPDPWLNSGLQTLPRKFTTDPIQVCVSQNGSNSGDDPVSTVGSATLYLVTATPA